MGKALNFGSFYGFIRINVCLLGKSWHRSPSTMVKTQQPAKKNPGGRPPKYSEPSRPVTVTLPESTLTGLKVIDPDRSQAIVKLTQSALRQGPNPQPLVEIVEMASNTGLLVIGPSMALKKIPFLHFIEVAPARFLLAMDPGNDFKTLEISIHDIIDEVPEEDVRERQMLVELLENIKKVRKSDRVSMAEILFVSLDHKRAK